MPQHGNTGANPAGGGVLPCRVCRMKRIVTGGVVVLRCVQCGEETVCAPSHHVKPRERPRKRLRGATQGELAVG